MDTDFMKIDFNPCGVSAGNPGPSYLAGVARCKDHTGVSYFTSGTFRKKEKI